MPKFLLPAAIAAFALAGAAQAENLHVNPSNGAISSAVKVPAGSEMLYVSGITPDMVAGAPAAAPFGDTKTQAASVLKKIGEILVAQGYGWEDAVMMRVLLVGDPAKGGGMDFAGMMESYNAGLRPAEEEAGPYHLAGRRPGPSRDDGRNRIAGGQEVAAPA